MSEIIIKALIEYCVKCKKFYTHGCTLDKFFVYINNYCEYKDCASQEWINKKLEDKKRYYKWISERCDF